MADFEQWIESLFNELDIDAEVYTCYILGIFEDVTSHNDDEIQESVAEILNSTLETADHQRSVDISKRILEKWKEFNSAKKKIECSAAKANMVQLMQDTVQPSLLTPPPPPVAPNQSLLSAAEKQRVLQCSSYELGDSSDEDADSGKTSKTTLAGLGAFANSNCKMVEEKQQQKRANMKASHEAKLERDRLGRQQQKQQVLDRKEREKKRTQKQEKRR